MIRKLMCWLGLHKNETKWFYQTCWTDRCKHCGHEQNGSNWDLR